MSNNRFSRASQIAAQSFRNSVVPVTAAFDPYEAWQAYQKAAEKAQNNNLDDIRKQILMARLNTSPKTFDFEREANIFALQNL